MLARVTGEAVAVASTTPALPHDFLLGCFFNDDTQTLAGSLSCLLLQKHKRYDFFFFFSHTLHGRKEVMYERAAFF
jgi:hypothetical protein